MCSLKKNKKNEGEFEPATEVMSTSLSQGPDSSERSRLSWVCRHHKAPVRNTFSGSTQPLSSTQLRYCWETYWEELYSLITPYCQL